MPYIGIRTSKTLTDLQKDQLAAALGKDITVIPGKVESKLMIDIADGHAMYFAGEKRDLVYLDVKCYGSTEFENKKAFTEAVFKTVQKETGVPENGIYLSYGEFANWGTMGSMK